MFVNLGPGYQVQSATAVHAGLLRVPTMW